MTHFRNILPPPVAIWLLALAYVGTLCLELGVTFFLSSVSENPFGRARFAVCVLAAAGFGGYRALWNHPLVRPGYFAWLNATPWRFPDPLPAGPPHWVWQDGIIVGAIVLLSLGAPLPDLYYIPIAFAVCYIAFLAVATAATAIYWQAYATVFLLSLTGLLESYSNGVVQLIPLVAAYIVGLCGLRQSLAAYPWNEQFDDAEHKWQGSMGFSVEARNRYTRRRAAGFPHKALAPSGPDFEVPYRHGFAIAATAAWLTFVVLATCDNTFVSNEVSKPILILAPGFVALFRTVAYCAQYWPPINLLGRVLTLRWVIPGYDRVFLTPIATLACGYTVTVAAWAGLVGYAAAAPVAVFVSLAIALNGGPSLTNWKLTGHHRIIAASTGLADCKKV